MIILGSEKFMRRNEKEIKDIREIEKIINKAIVCRIALCDNDKPYIVPVNFGYRDGCLYIHSAKEGKKIDILKKNNNISFEIDTDVEFVRAEEPCDCTMKYLSVIGSGKAYIVKDLEEKRKALNILVEHYLGSSHEFSYDQLDMVTIIKVEIESMTGKKSEYYQVPD